MHSKKIFLVITAFFMLFSACKKDQPVSMDDGGAGGPTAYTVPLPSWVLDSIGPMTPAPNNATTIEGVALGRRLFYDKMLSNDYSMSCGSCHKQENAFSDPRPFSVGTDGSVGSRNAMAVINLGWEHQFFWDGRADALETQAFGPVANPIEMRNTWPVVVDRLQADADYPALFEAAFGTSTIDSTLVVKAIGQFERTLVSFSSRFDSFHHQGDSSALNAQEQAGLTIFMRDGHCVDCHRDELMFDHSQRNNGLDMDPVDGGLGALTGNPNDWGKFKVPTLRNIAVTGPYMHDSRFNTLEEVVNFYAHNVQVNNPHLDAHMDPWRFGLVNLSPQDELDLVAFLHTLTDNGFLTNPAFGPPQ